MNKKIIFLIILFIITVVSLSFFVLRQREIGGKIKCQKNNECSSAYCEFNDVYSRVGICVEGNNYLNKELFKEKTFKQIATLSENEEMYFIKNSNIEVGVEKNGFGLKISDKRNSQGYDIESISDLEIMSAEKVKSGYLFETNFLQKNIKIEAILFDDFIKISLMADPQMVLENNFEFPGTFSLTDNDFLVLPVNYGELKPVKDIEQNLKMDFYGSELNMSFVGVTNMKSGFMFITDDPWDTGFSIKDKKFSLNHYLVNKKFSYNRSFYLYLTEENSFVDMALKYRRDVQGEGYFKPFVDKLSENKNIEKLIGASGFELETTDFKTQKIIMDNLIEAGVMKALLSFSTKEIDPVFMDFLQKKNFLVYKKEIFGDVLSSSSTMSLQEEAQKAMLSNIDKNDYTAHFIKIMNSDENRSNNQRERALYEQQLLKFLNNFGLILGTDNLNSWNTLYIDWLNIDIGKENNFKKVIPLQGIVYRDVLVSSVRYEDEVQEKNKQLFNILYGTMPVFVISEQDDIYGKWQDILSTHHLVSSVFEITGYEKIKSHKYIGKEMNVQEVEFSHGWKTLVNFGDKEYKFEDKILPAKGFYVSGPAGEIYKILKNKKEIAVVNLKDRLFIDPFSKKQEILGIKTDVPVLFKKLANNQTALAIIGDTAYIDVDKEALPKNLQNNIFVDFGENEEYKTEKLWGTWVRVYNKPRIDLLAISKLAFLEKYVLENETRTYEIIAKKKIEKEYLGNSYLEIKEYIKNDKPKEALAKVDELFKMLNIVYK